MYATSLRRLTEDEESAMTPSVWRPGCPVSLDELRRVEVAYWTFGDRVRTGALVVRETVAAEVGELFGDLFDLRFPIRRMVPIERYGGDDYTSIEADNTSAFNCRAVTGSTEWSNHAYGIAIDINPLENPYVLAGETSHAGSEPYLDRSDVRPGMLVEDSPEVAVFEDAGWYWGGRWSDPIDYQHLSARPG